MFDLCLEFGSDYRSCFRLNVTSRDSATAGSGTVLNQIKYEYNGFNQLVKESQEHSGSVSSSPYTEYSYASGGSSSNIIRPTNIIYPAGRQIDYDYGTSSAMNDKLSRIESLKDSSTVLAAYTYLGAGAVIQIDYQQPDVMLDLWGGTTGTFTGFDQFGRVWASWRTCW